MFPMGAQMFLSVKFPNEKLFLSFLTFLLDGILTFV